MLKVTCVLHCIGIVFSPLLLWKEDTASRTEDLSDELAAEQVAQQKHSVLAIAKCVEWLIINNELVQALFPSAGVLGDDDNIVLGGRVRVERSVIALKLRVQVLVGPR